MLSSSPTSAVAASYSFIEQPQNNGVAEKKGFLSPAARREAW